MTRVRSTLLLFFFAAMLLPVTVFAQLNFNAPDLSISISPEFPGPRDVVHVRARSTLIELSGATIAWFENGKKIAAGIGLSEIDIVAGELGSETNLTVTVTEEGVEQALATARIRPVEVDLLWESDSFVPPLFHGRALPSAGTHLRLEAVPRFKREDGSRVPIRDITFTWRKNGYVIESVSGRGKSKALVESPPLFGTDTISVEARTSDGLFEGVASTRIPSTEPLLALYENHPLFGIMYHRALSAQSSVPEVETSFAAVPYFAEAADPNDSRLLYEWRVNGNAVTNDASHPSEITISARGSSGSAIVELVLSHATNLFLRSSGTWRIMLLGENRAAPQENTSSGTP